MKVGYNRTFSVAGIVLGAVLLARGLWSLADDGFTIGLITGPLLMLAAIQMLFRPLFEYDPTTRTITVTTIARTMTRRYGGFDGGRLSVAGDRIMCTSADGSTKKVTVSRLLARRADWDAVVAQLD